MMNVVNTKRKAKLYGFDCLIKFIHCVKCNKFNIVNNNDYFYNVRLQKKKREQNCDAK